MKPEDCDKLITEALLAAKTAVDNYFQENPGQWYPCGFSWVNVKPARGPLIAALKSAGLGSKDEYAGGWSIWNPAGSTTQCMDAKAAGSEAFAQVLRAAGFNAVARTRID